MHIILKRGVGMIDGVKIKKIFLALFITTAIIFAIISSAKVSAAIYIKEKTDGGIFLPVIFYNEICEECENENSAITFKELDADLAYLFDKGYTAIYVSDLISFTENKTSLPEKPIMITFDSSCRNEIIKIVSLLKKYNMKAVFSISGAAVQDNPENITSDYGLSWENISSITKSGYIEFANQSYNMNSIDGRQGSSRMANETLMEYKNVFIADIMKLQYTLDENFNIKPMTYAFPYGIVCTEAVDILQSLGFKAYFSQTEKANYIVADSEKIISLNRYRHISGVSTNDFMKKALRP